MFTGTPEELKALREVNPHYDHICKMKEKLAELKPEDGERFFVVFDGETFIARWQEEDSCFYPVNEPEENGEWYGDLEDILGRVEKT
jgi:hypothetical protein